MLLIDLLEHVPDCRALVASLAKFTKYFLIKLPVESSVLDNYILPKEYPGPLHSNGHLRGFDANRVHYFIRQLGLTPLFESLYVYHLEDIFPPAFRALPFRQKMIRGVLKFQESDGNGAAQEDFPETGWRRWLLLSSNL